MMNLNAGTTDAPLPNWPIQLRLASPQAPYLQNADLLLAADCVAFALPNFHRQIGHGRPLLIACPKLDDTAPYVEKLAEIMRTRSIRSLTVVHMQVPCCTGLLRVAEAARQLAGATTPIESVVISTRGEILTGTTRGGPDSLAIGAAKPQEALSNGPLVPPAHR